MAGDALKLSENCTDHSGAQRSFHSQKFFDRFAIAEAVAHGCHIIHAVDVWGELLIGAILCYFLHATMKVADYAFGSTDTLAIQF